jgi:hypothetical protein
MNDIILNVIARFNALSKLFKTMNIFKHLVSKKIASLSKKNTLLRKEIKNKDILIVILKKRLGL